MQCLQGFFERGAVIVAMNLIEIDVVGAEAV
jgi:hypothetical protein